MKKGLMTKDEAKFFGKVLADKIPVSGMWQQVLKWFLPNAIDNLDDKFGDKLPEPWQTHIELLITKLYDAMQDDVLSQEERDDLVLHCSTIIASGIDIPKMDEQDEIESFILLIKWGASLIRTALKKS